MLYSAKVDDVAKPVTSTDASPTLPKPKRIQSEKQIAALAKAQETRKANLAAAKASGLVPEKKVRVRKVKEVKDDEPIHPDVETTPSESASAVATLVEEPAPVDKKVEEIVKPILMKEDKKGKRKAVDMDDTDINPPAWFKTFIRNTRKEEAKASKGVKVPAKQVQEEADKFTKEQWQDGFTRDRIKQQSDAHLKKMHLMYNQMFYKS